MEQLEELETSPQGERSNAVLTDTYYRNKLRII